MKPKETMLTLPVEHNDLRNHWGTGSRRGFAHAHRPETLRSVLIEGFWFAVCVGLLIAITSVQ